MDPVVKFGGARLRLAAHEGVEDDLVASDGDWAAGREAPGELPGGGADIALGNRVDEVQPGRFGRAHALAGEQDDLGIGQADLTQQKLALERAVDDPKPARRNEEDGTAARDAEVAGEGNGAAAADCISVDLGDGRLAAFENCKKGRLLGLLIG